jgi:GTP cyclohydrolase II
MAKSPRITTNKAQRMNVTAMPKAAELASLEAKGERRKIAVERALAEMRAGRPILLRDGEDAALVLPAESLEPEQVDELEALAGGAARLVLPAARLRRLGEAGRAAPAVVALPTLDAARVGMLALAIDGRLDAPLQPASSLDAGALELTAMAQLLPPAVIVPIDARARPAFVVETMVQDVQAYRKAAMSEVRLVSRAPVPLEGPDGRAIPTQFAVFRGGEGMRDQVAILVGEPDLAAPVAVRLHSACLTGDLFGSLKCDCGDQLRSTVRWMAENEGGVLLYLDQEGRGNGIANKMRAYRLQAKGWDTYDADEALGFEKDQRHFDFAAQMLKQLGVSAVRIMTNNPVKIAAMRQAGLEVVEDKRVIGRPSTHNIAYLASKRERAGHLIDIEALSEQEMIDD